MQQQTSASQRYLAHLERTLGDTADSARERVSDPGMKERLGRIAQRHRRQAEELDTGTREDVDESAKRESDAIRREIEHARGENGLMAALAHVEQEQAERYRELRDGADDALREVLDRHLSTFEQDRLVFMEQSVGIGQIRDPHEAP